MAFNTQGINWAALAALASGNSPGEQLGNANNVIANQTVQAQQVQAENQTKNWLTQNFPGEDFSSLSGDALKSAYNVGLQRYAQAKQPKKPSLISIGNGYLYNPDSGEYVKPPEGFTQNSISYGKQPIWFKGPDGKLKLGVPGDDGTLKELDTPDGYEPLPGISNVDLGTSNASVNNKTGDVVQSHNKDVSGVEEQKVLGKDKGEIKAALPSARFTARVVSDEIKEIINDPALPQALGPIESRLPTMREATSRVESRIKKLAGQSFLQAREMLRGGGQITDFEGKKAEEAMARLDRAQSVDDFKDALREFDAAVAEGIRKLEAAAEGRDYNPGSNEDSQMNTTTNGRKWKVIGQ